MWWAPKATTGANIIEPKMAIKFEGRSRSSTPDELKGNKTAGD